MSYLMSFFNSSFFIGIATLIIATVTIYLYYKEQRKKKRDAAKIILQEIRRAEAIINEYKRYGLYQLTQKIIAINSWKSNVHYFVGNLDQDEMDKISYLYSTGEYLDRLIVETSDQKVSVLKEVSSKGMEQFAADNPGMPTAKKGSVQSIQITHPTEGLLRTVSQQHQPIYHTCICEKLKKIAKLK